MENQLEELFAYLNQADALLTVATTTDLIPFEPDTVFHYLWATSTLVGLAKAQCVRLFD